MKSAISLIFADPQPSELATYPSPRRGMAAMIPVELDVELTDMETTSI